MADQTGTDGWSKDGDDIVTRLTEPNAGVTSDQWHTMRQTMLDAADEIERLRAALALAVGEMSTSGEYSYLSFDQLMQHFMEESDRG